MYKFLVLGAVALFSTAASAASDNFDRATLGKKWVVTDGTLSISNDQMAGGNNAMGYLKKSSGDSTVSVDVILTTTTQQYGAVASGDIAHHQNAFVKIQSTSGGVAFDRGAFYIGDNVNTTGIIFNLKALVLSPARLEASFCGTMAKMTIKSSGKTQKYAFDYGMSFGQGGGLGTYGGIALDNYKSAPASCKFDPDTVMIKKTTGRHDTTIVN